MGGFAIPLSYQNPTFQNPAQMQQQGLQTRNLMQQGQTNQLQQSLMQQQIQEGQMKLGAQQALNDAIKRQYSASPATPASPGTPAPPGGAAAQGGMPALDYGAIAKDLAQNGWGAQVPGMMSGVLKMQSEVAELAKTRAENVKNLAAAAAQSLQGVNDDQGYQAAMPQLRAAAIAAGRDPDTIMPHYDPAVVKQYIAMGTDGANYASQMQHAADLALRVTENRPKSIEEYSRQIQSDLAQARSQSDLDAVSGKWTTLGAPKEMLALIPKTWNSNIPAQAANSVIPLDKQPEFQEKGFTAAAQRMGAAAGQSQQAYAAEYRNLDPQLQGMFPPPDQWTPPSTAGGGTRQAALEAGVTPQQFITAQNTEAYRKSTEAYRQTRLQQFDRALDLKEGDGSGTGQTANSRAVDKRADSNAYNKLLTEEDTAKFLRNRLGTALTGNGGQFVDVKGNLLDPQTATGANAGLGKMSPDQQRQDMMQRFDAVTAQLSRIGAQKNDILTRAGTPPAMSTGQYQSWLDSTSAKVHGAVPAVTPPVTTPTTPPATPAAPPATPVTPSVKPPVTPAAPPKPAAVPPAAAPAGKPKAGAPPASVLTQVPEGKSFRSPDGTLWKKVNGQAVQQ